MKDTLKFRIAVRKFGPFETAIDKIWKAFCKQTGCTLTLEAVPFELHPLYDATLGKEDGLLKGDWDIMQVNTDWIAEAGESGKLIDLRPYIDATPPIGGLQAWSDALTDIQTFGDKIIGLPFHDGPECLIFRKDLFEREKEKTDFRNKFGRELSPPVNWDEFIDVAGFFQRPEDNLYGTVMAAFPDGHNTVFDLCLQIWTRGSELTDEHGRVNIDTSQAKEGLEFYSRLLKDDSLIHPDSREFDSVKSGMAFARGEIAMMVNWFGFASMCEVTDFSKVKGKVDIRDVPAGRSGKAVSLNAYWMYAIANGSLDKQLAYDFIRFALNPENDRLLTLEGGIGCRRSTWNDAKVNETVPYYSKLEELHRNSRTLPRKAHWAEISKVIDRLVLEAISAEKNPAKILEEAQSEIEEIERKHS